jgi:hypothetical protein
VVFGDAVHPAVVHLDLLPGRPLSDVLGPSRGSAQGVASAVLGFGTPVGIIIGVNIASRLDQFRRYTMVPEAVMVATWP